MAIFAWSNTPTHRSDMAQQKPIGRCPCQVGPSYHRQPRLTPPNLGSGPRETLAAARRPQRCNRLRTKDASNGAAGGAIPCSSSPSPSRSPSPSPAMGCAASTDRAGRRRRDRALGHSEASTVPQHNGPQDPVQVAAAAGRRRGCKVAPEPKEEEQPAPALARPCSPSFRYYCQKAAAVDAMVAAADADGGDSEGAVRVADTPQAITKNDLADSSSSSKSKEASGWLKFRGMSLVATVYSLFNRQSSAASATAAAAAKSRHPSAASPPAATAVATP